MQERKLEVSVGLFMLLGLMAFIFLAFKVSGLAPGQAKGNFVVEACFNDIGGLKSRSKVTLAGVKVGQVGDIHLNQQWFEACVDLHLDASLLNKLSSDTAAAIQTAGLLGDNYISLTPGIEEDFLVQGSSITDTQSALILEQLINQFISSSSQ